LCTVKHKPADATFVTRLTFPTYIMFANSCTKGEHVALCKDVTMAALIMVIYKHIFTLRY